MSVLVAGVIGGRIVLDSGPNGASMQAESAARALQ